MIFTANIKRLLTIGLSMCICDSHRVRNNYQRLIDGVIKQTASTCDMFFYEYKTQAVQVSWNLCEE